MLLTIEEMSRHDLKSLTGTVNRSGHSHPRAEAGLIEAARTPLLRCRFVIRSALGEIQ